MKRLHQQLAIIASLLLIALYSYSTVSAKGTDEIRNSRATEPLYLLDSLPQVADSIKTKPLPTGPISDINYSSSRRYRVEGINVVGGDGFNEDVLLSISGINVGDVVEIPGPAISDAIRRYMRNGYFKNVVISVVAEEGDKIW